MSESNTVEQINEIIKMNDVNVSYEGKEVINNLQWTVKKGQKWAILGPKIEMATILKLILGQHSQAFTNDIKLFNQKIEANTIEDLKKNITVVTSGIDITYPKKVTGLEVILSGFFDSPALYYKASSEQRSLAEELAGLFNITKSLKYPFAKTANGQKRVLLMARAATTSTPLLIFDEPTHGLNPEDRQQMLEMIEYMCKTDRTIVMTTTNEAEIVPGMKYALHYEEGTFIEAELKEE